MERYGSADVYEHEQLSPQPEFVPDWVMRVWQWIYRPSLRPDRSAALAVEPRGRFDKLDLWVVVALIAVILSMRVYRLDEPLQMHFDEVYHARTATEFLQDWRYDIPHDIFEWTHPHLAKYAIAGGLVVFSDDKVTATSQLGVSVKDAVVQPRITPSTPAQDDSTNDPRANPDARLGDRLYVATGDAVRAYDLQTRTLEATYPIPGASSLSLAADTGYLYAGTSDGHVWRIDTNSLDDVRLGLAKEPVKAAELSGQTDFPIVKLYAGSPPLILAVDATGDIDSMDGTGKIVGRGTVEGAADFAPLSAGLTTVSAIPSQVTDPSAEAAALASAAGVDPAEIEGLLRSGSSGGLEVPLPLGTLSQTRCCRERGQPAGAGCLPERRRRHGCTARRDQLDGRHGPAGDIHRDQPQRDRRRLGPARVRGRRRLSHPGSDPPGRAGLHYQGRQSAAEQDARARHQGHLRRRQQDRPGSRSHARRVGLDRLCDRE
jgi:hypothetical protein